MHSKPEIANIFVAEETSIYEKKVIYKNMILSIRPPPKKYFKYINTTKRRA